MSVPRADDPGAPAPDLIVTGALLKRAQSGDPRALEALLARYRPRLERWASGRLPLFARSLFDTGDLVQETLLKAIEGLDLIEVRHPGSFQAYVRQAVLNRIRDQMRWARRRPGSEGVPDLVEDRTPSPLETAIGADVLDRYERALDTLRDEERQLLHLRIELDYSYEEIAVITERKTRDAARMAVQRALRRLAEAMDYER
jgi:RNA polymerase sigma-70 factor (ECF subfamily)